MKYLFINSVAGFGSTGRIAGDTCRELMAQGHTCTIAYGRKQEGYEDVPTVRIGSNLTCRLHGLRSRLLDDQGFGSRASTRRFLSWVRQYDPDVIWLHNLHGYYINLEELFGYLRTCGKKILWTLHDCWSFTGHCAYFEMAGCDKWKTGCGSCPQKGAYPKSILLDGSRRNFERKKALFTGIPNLTLIVPSQWLQHRVEESFLKEYPVEVHYNEVNRAVFKPTPGDFREKMGLTEKKILLGVASVWEERKGLKDFIALSRLLPEAYRIVLIGLKPEQIQALPKEIVGLPRTKNVQGLAEVYTAADVFINPSLEETFGMTTLEANCCGTPAIVYRDTACEEIACRFGGLAVERGAENLLKAVLTLTKEETL